MLKLVLDQIDQTTILMRYFSAFKAHYGTDQDLPTTPHILLIGPVVVHWRGKLKGETDLSRKTFVNDKSRKDIHNNIYCCTTYLVVERKNNNNNYLSNVKWLRAKVPQNGEENEENNPVAAVVCLKNYTTW